MNIKYKLLDNLFILGKDYNIEEAFSFSDNALEETAYAIFIEELLEKHNYIKLVGTYVIKDDDINKIKNSLSDLNNCSNKIGNNLRIDIYDSLEDEFKVFTYFDKDDKELKEIFSLSSLKYFFNDYKRLKDIEYKLETTFEIYKDEDEYIKDPYGYYGVNRKDFY